jgi:UDP-glucuronate 4-epimerase
MNTYNHIYGLSISGLQFFTISAPRVRPNMTYFPFTWDILNGKPINTYTKEPTTKIWLMISLTLMTLSKRDVLHRLMWWMKTQVVEGRRQVVWLCMFNLGMLVLQTLLHTLVDILEKYLNLKSKREIVKMPCDGDVPFTDANNISAAQA